MAEGVVNDDNETGVSALLSQSGPKKPEMNEQFKITLLKPIMPNFFPTRINWTSPFPIFGLLGDMFCGV